MGGSAGGLLSCACISQQGVEVGCWQEHVVERHLGRRLGRTIEYHPELCGGRVGFHNSMRGEIESLDNECFNVLLGDDFCIVHPDVFPQCFLVVWQLSFLLQRPLIPDKTMESCGSGESQFRSWVFSGERYHISARLLPAAGL